MFHIDIKFSKRAEGGYSAKYRDPLAVKRQKITNEADQWKHACAVVKGEDGLWYPVPELGMKDIGGQKNRKAVVREVVSRELNASAEGLEEDLTFDNYYQNYSRGNDNRRISGDLANRIYDILIDECGASDRNYEREMFLHSHAGDPPSGNEHYRTHEYRFSGHLGFGGKFWNDHNKFRVSAYPEHMSADVRLMVARANKRLQELYRETWPYTP